MNILPVNSFSYNIKPYFKGEAELRQFRHDAKDVLDRLDKMETPFEYNKADKDKHNLSIQAMLKKILFSEVSTVGAKYAMAEDRSNLAKIKKAYVEHEKEQSFFDTMQQGAGRIIDRTEEVRDIDF